MSHKAQRMVGTHAAIAPCFFLQETFTGDRVVDVDDAAADDAAANAVSWLCTSIIHLNAPPPKTIHTDVVSPNTACVNLPLQGVHY
jgi:hypothetical protein